MSVNYVGPLAKVIAYWLMALGVVALATIPYQLAYAAYLSFGVAYGYGAYLGIAALYAILWCSNLALAFCGYRLLVAKDRTALVRTRWISGSLLLVALCSGLVMGNVDPFFQVVEGHPLPGRLAVYVIAAVLYVVPFVLLIASTVSSYLDEGSTPKEPKSANSAGPPVYKGIYKG